MIWVAVVGAIALAGMVALVIYGIGLKHKFDDVMVEANVVATRAREMRALVGQVQQALPKRD